MISPGSARSLRPARGFRPGRRLGKAGIAKSTGSRGTAEAAGTEGTAEAAGTRGTPRGTRTEATAEAVGTKGTAEGAGTKGTAKGAGTRGTAWGTGTEGTAEAAGTKGTARGTGTKRAARGTGTQGSVKGTGTKRTGKATGAKVRAAKATTEPDGTDQPVDLRGLIERFADPQVTVSCPASPVPLPASAAAALSGATAAALDNVRQHAGADAHAWVLVEDAGETVQVSIRDNGTGFADGRLAKATAAGRLGVSHSIVGRLREVGGTAWVTSAPGQGTEVELAVPRTAQRTGPSGPRPHRGRSSDLA